MSAEIEPLHVHVAMALSLTLVLALVWRSVYGEGAKETTASAENKRAPTPAFKRFANGYIAVYLLMMAGDWLQGPYMYALYAEYGFEHEQIASLFVAGFGSSMLFGTFAGSLADTIGRKRGALLYVAFYVASCVTKHWKSYGVLMLGRVLGGIATSLLFCVFDSWLVTEHAARGFEASWLSSVFANAQAGNSIVAIASGVLGEWVASLAPLQQLSKGGGSIMWGGYCAPFDLAAVFLLVGGVVIAATWTENFGESKKGHPTRAASAKTTLTSSFAAAVGSTLDSLGKGCTLLFRDPKVLLVGLVSACFEAAMYAFVFEWTPAVSGPPGSPKPPYGEIFSVMMLCCTGGTRVFSAIVGRGHTSPSQLLAPTCWLSALALAAPFAALTLTAGAPLPTLAAFLLFEGCVGAYFPAMGTLKSITVPDAQRSTVYSLFRIPLNLLVLTVLLSRMPTRHVFAACVALLLCAATMQHALDARLASRTAADDDEARLKLAAPEPSVLV